MGTNKIKKFFSLDIFKQLLFLEAFIMLGWARCLKMLKFNKLTKRLKLDLHETKFEGIAGNERVIAEISEAIDIMSRHTIWESMCLVRAIAGMKMLERRKVSSTLYLGTGKNAKGELIAHAWLRSGDQFVTGGEEKENFTVVGIFSRKIEV
jgi:hypothetical protein